jgi:hypothetical protein
MSVMDVNDKSIIKNILSNENNYRISRSGNYIVHWGAGYSNNSWSVINWDGTNDRVLINKSDIAPTGEAYLLGWSKTEDKIYFSTRLTSSSTNEIYYEIDPQGSIKQIANAPEYESEYDDENISPDKTKIVYDYCKYPSIVSNLFITNYVSGEDPSGGEDITSQITNKELGLAE